MAMYEERQSAALSTTVSWLEDELREAKATLARQQQAIEGLTGQIWELTDALHRAETLLASVPPQLEILPAIEEQLRGLKDDLGRFHEQGLTTEVRLGEVARLQATDAERERTALNELVHRIDTAERGYQVTLPRFDQLDEATRRATDAAAGVRQQTDEIDRAVEAVEGRLARLADLGGRTEQEFARLNGEIETLHRQDGTVAERVQIYTEVLKRLEAQIAQVSAEVAVKQDVFERIELTRIELHRLEERISVQEARTEDLREANEDVRRSLTMLDGRDKGLYDRLTGLQNDLAGHRGAVSEQFGRLHQAQERAKRRQIEELERDIREMRTHAFRPIDDGS